MREFAGIGGDAMRAAGLDAWFDASELAVMGLAEVLRHLPRLLRLRRDVARRDCWRGSPTCSSASTRPTSTSASRSG